jgi:hypothetical protein
LGHLELESIPADLFKTGEDAGIVERDVAHQDPAILDVRVAELDGRCDGGLPLPPHRRSRGAVDDAVAVA